MDTAALANKAIDAVHEALVAALAEVPRGQWRSIATNIAVPERLAPAVVADLQSTSQTELETGEVIAWAPASRPGDFGPRRAAWIVNVSWFLAGTEAYVKIEAVIQG